MGQFEDLSTAIYSTMPLLLAIQWGLFSNLLSNHSFLEHDKGVDGDVVPRQKATAYLNSSLLCSTPSTVLQKNVHSFIESSVTIITAKSLFPQADVSFKMSIGADVSCWLL